VSRVLQTRKRPSTKKTNLHEEMGTELKSKGSPWGTESSWKRGRGEGRSPKGKKSRQTPRESQNRTGNALRDIT